MTLLLLEALGALLIFIFIVWWTMFAGRKGGEPPPAEPPSPTPPLPAAPSTAPPATTARDQGGPPAESSPR